METRALPASLERTAPQEVRQTGRERGLATTSVGREGGKPGRARLLVYNPLRKIDFPVPSAKQSVGWGQAVVGLVLLC